MVNQNAAGVDIGAHEIMVCIPGADHTQLVRSFGNYTTDLYAIAKWFGEHNIYTVAMESTGVYWIPLFEVLEAQKFNCLLISSNSLRRVPGRKSDVIDAQWIQTLHAYGLLSGSFRPESDLVALRTLLRHRARLLEHRAPHILHMQKALLQMNLQLSQVLTDITGETGFHIIRAIVNGERDPNKLAAMRNHRCKKDENEIKSQIKNSKGVGNFRSLYLNIPNGKKDSVQLLPVGDIATKDEFERIKNISRAEILAMWRIQASLAGVMPDNPGGFGDIEKIATVYFEYETVPMQDVFLQLNQYLPKNLYLQFGAPAKKAA